LVLRTSNKAVPDTTLFIDIFGNLTAGRRNFVKQ